ncbi:MAG: hypothetical protein RBU45_21935 [Myxococcota bacterium]|jgi:hypothetical protein|nr:hypothetical protein [Myxococcota bacterium]
MTVLYYQLQKNCRLSSRLSLEEIAPLLHDPRLRAQLLTGTKATFSGAIARVGTLEYQLEAGGPPQRLSSEPAELLRRLQELYRLRRRCKDCEALRPASPLASEWPLSCVGELPLPLPARLEQLLLQVVDDLLASSAELEPTVTLPIRYLWDNGLDGEELRQLRDRPDLFARSTATEARIGPFLEKQRLDTDQLLSLFLLPGLHPGPELHLLAPFATEFVQRARLRLAPEDLAVLEPLLPLFEAVATASDLGVGLQLILLGDRNPALPSPPSPGDPSRPDLQATKTPPSSPTPLPAAGR